jgi:hypothetical protein
MEATVAVRAARGTLAMVLVAIAVGALGASAASAKPGLGLVARLPLAGPSVNLACANPANVGQAGSVLSAVSTSVGGPLRCFGRALAQGHDAGPRTVRAPSSPGALARRLLGRPTAVETT